MAHLTVSFVAVVYGNAVPHYAILGPLELTTGARRVSLEGRRKLGLLVVLLLHANEVVAADVLVDAVWRDSAPEGAHKRLRMTIARLRETLAMCGEAGGPPLRTVRGGYVLEVREGELDVDVFDAAVRDGRRALAAGDARRAARLLRGALALWRGPPLADVGYEDWAQPEIRRLEELRLVAHQARIDADLQLGGHAALVGELEDLVARHPTHERIAEQLMVALYRCGRQADALDVFGRARLQLSTQLGLAPGPRLRALQSAVLAQSPSLELAPELTPRTPPGPYGCGATIALPARPPAPAFASLRQRRGPCVRARATMPHASGVLTDQRCLGLPALHVHVNRPVPTDSERASTHRLLALLSRPSAL